MFADHLKDNACSPKILSVANPKKGKDLFGVSCPKEDVQEKKKIEEFYSKVTGPGRSPNQEIYGVCSIFSTKLIPDKLIMLKTCLWLGVDQEPPPQTEWNKTRQVRFRKGGWKNGV